MDKLHHETDATRLPVPDTGNGAVVSRPKPIDQVYFLKQRTQSTEEPPKQPDATVKSRTSMFHRGKKGDIKDDRFLQRLSRLK